MNRKLYLVLAVIVCIIVLVAIALFGGSNSTPPDTGDKSETPSQSVSNLPPAQTTGPKGDTSSVVTPPTEDPVTPPQEKPPVVAPPVIDTPGKEPEKPAEPGKSGAEIYDEVKSWGLWREWVSSFSARKTLTATDPLHGGVEVGISSDGLISITMREENQSAWFKNDEWVDATGKYVSDELKRTDFVDKNGKFILSSGWSYEARQLVKRILATALPDSADETYQALLSVMKQEIWESPTYSLPSALRWLENRSFLVTMDDGNYAVTIYIGPSNEREYYDEFTTGTKEKDFYNPKNGSRLDVPARYELNRG